MTQMQQRVDTSGVVTNADLARTGPSTVAGRYLRRFWMPVAKLDDVAPGRGRTIQILGERLTYFRGASGAPHLIGAECAHRGTLLSTGRVVGECLSCFYHGWTYDGNGQCVDQPAEDDAFAAKVYIPGYPTREYLGLVFAYLGEGEPPAFPRLEAFEKKGFIEARAFPRDTNFFNQLENSVDTVHFNFVHQRSSFEDKGINREIPSLSGFETDYGIVKSQRYSDGKDRIGHILMPTTLYTLVIEDGFDLWKEHLSWRVPTTDVHHVTFTLDLIDCEGAELDRYLATREERRRLVAQFEPAADVVAAVLRSDVHIDDVPREHPMLLIIQDDVALAAQGPLFDRATDRLGKSDMYVILLRKIWLRELRALVIGAPLKEWSWPKELSVTTGV